MKIARPGKTLDEVPRIPWVAHPHLGNRVYRTMPGSSHANEVAFVSREDRDRFLVQQDQLERYQDGLWG